MLDNSRHLDATGPHFHRAKSSPTLMAVMKEKSKTIRRLRWMQSQNFLGQALIQGAWLFRKHIFH